MACKRTREINNTRCMKEFYFSACYNVKVCLTIVNGFLDPVFQVDHVTVDPVAPLACAPHCPAYVTNQVPLAILLADQRSSTVSLTCVNCTYFKPGAAHSVGDIVSGQICVACLAGFAWNQRNTCLLKELQKMKEGYFILAYDIRSNSRSEGKASRGEPWE